MHIIQQNYSLYMSYLKFMYSSKPIVCMCWGMGFVVKMLHEMNNIENRFRCLLKERTEGSI